MSSVNTKQFGALTIPPIVRETADRFPDRVAILIPGREPIACGRLFEQVDRRLSSWQATSSGFASSSKIAHLRPCVPRRLRLEASANL